MIIAQCIICRNNNLEWVYLVQDLSSNEIIFVFNIIFISFSFSFLADPVLPRLSSPLSREREQYILYNIRHIMNIPTTSPRRY